LPGESEEKDEKPQPEWPILNPGPSKYEGVLTNQDFVS
jgi:hypothetical protein